MQGGHTRVAAGENKSEPEGKKKKERKKQQTQQDR